MPVYDNVPLVVGTDLTYPDGTIFRISNLGFYVSDLVLVANSSVTGDELTEIAEISWIDLNFENAEAALNGTVIAADNIPEGNYLGLQMGLGVAADLNREQPKDYGSEHPLGNATLYRPDWRSYVFCRLEGFASTDGGATFGQPIEFNLGMDEIFQEEAQIRSINIVKDQTSDVIFQIEIRDFLILQRQFVTMMETNI